MAEVIAILKECFSAVEQVASAKSLEVYIDQTLNWVCHIGNVCK